MKVIALTGRAGSGKDTAATMLQILTGATIAPVSSNPGFIDLEAHMRHTQDFLYTFDKFNMCGGFNAYKFAFPVYQIVSVLLGIPDPYTIMNQAFKDSITPFGLTGRELLQKVGTECFRDVLGKDTWCKVLKNKTEGDTEDEHFKGAIVSDLRFLNEEAFLRTEYDTFVIYIQGRDSGVPLTHPSEAEIQKIRPDIVLNNTGTYLNLMNQLAAATKYLNIYNCKYTW